MNARERVLRAMRRQQPDRVPVDFSWGLTQGALETFYQHFPGGDPAEIFELDVRFVSPELPIGWGSEPDLHAEAALDPERPGKAAAFQRYLPDLAPGDAITEWGIGHRRGSEAHFIAFLHPLANLRRPEDVEVYPFPRFEEEWRWQRVTEQVEAHHRRGLCVGGMASSSIFETSWMLRGMERLLEDLLSEPELAGALLDRVATLRCEQACRLARAGVDVLVLGDDVASQTGMMMSPRLWRTWFKPRLAQVIAAAKAAQPGLLIFYHCDGDLRKIIPDLIEIGVEILNPVQPECMDPLALKAEYGSRLAFWGTIGTQTVLPFGTPVQVKEEVRRRIETVGAGGGLLIGPSHMIEPEVPWENLVAMVEAARQYGTY